MIGADPGLSAAGIGVMGSVLDPVEPGVAAVPAVGGNPIHMPRRPPPLPVGMSVPQATTKHANAVTHTMEEVPERIRLILPSAHSHVLVSRSAIPVVMLDGEGAPPWQKQNQVQVC